MSIVLESPARNAVRKRTNPYPGAFAVNSYSRGVNDATLSRVACIRRLQPVGRAGGRVRVGDRRHAGLVVPDVDVGGDRRVALVPCEGAEPDRLLAVSRRVEGRLRLHVATVHRRGGFPEASRRERVPQLILVRAAEASHVCREDGIRASIIEGLTGISTIAS